MAEKYGVSLANKDCIFDSEEFETLAEAKKWIDDHGCGFRAMIEGPGIHPMEPRSNFYVSAEGEYQYQDGWGEWITFDPFKFNKEHYARIEIKCKPEVKRELVARAKAADLTLSQYMLKKALE